MLGSSNANIVQAYSWSCLTPPHLESKRYALHMSPTPVKELENVTVNLLQMSPTLQQRGNIRPCASKPATARISTWDEGAREEALLTTDAKGDFETATQPTLESNIVKSSYATNESGGKLRFAAKSAKARQLSRSGELLSRAHIE